MSLLLLFNQPSGVEPPLAVGGGTEFSVPRRRRRPQPVAALEVASTDDDEAIALVLLLI